MDLRDRNSVVAGIREKVHLANGMHTISWLMKQYYHQLAQLSTVSVTQRDGYGLIGSIANLNQSISASTTVLSEGPAGEDSVPGACICG